MNTTELALRPDVAAFVARVRESLADLPEEDRLELTEGLEADLTDQVTEHGGAVLGDPEAYARELRSAAGLEPTARRRRRAAAVSLPQSLDDVRSWWDGQVARPRIAPVWSVLVTLRPAWWLLRAWAAAVVVARLVPGWYPYGLTWLPGVAAPLALLILLACVAGSTLVGLGRVWPGAGAPGGSGAAARLVLVLLNVVAVLALPFLNGYLDRLSSDNYSEGYANARLDQPGRREGVLNRGQQVCNIAAYDASGQPLVGVQLFDQAGRPLDVQCYGQAGRTVPWVLGDVTRWNVFPLGVRASPARTPESRSDLSDAAFPTPDRATTPEVTNPLVPVVDEPTDAGKGDGKKGRKDGRKDGARTNDRRP